MPISVGDPPRSEHGFFMLAGAAKRLFPGSFTSFNSYQQCKSSTPFPDLVVRSPALTLPDWVLCSSKFHAAMEAGSGSQSPAPLWPSLTQMIFSPSISKPWKALQSPQDFQQCSISTSLHNGYKLKYDIKIKCPSDRYFLTLRAWPHWIKHS